MLNNSVSRSLFFFTLEQHCGALEFQLIFRNHGSRREQKTTSWHTPFAQRGDDNNFVMKDQERGKCPVLVA